MAKDQAELKGIERPVIRAVEDAAEAYVAVRDKRMTLTEKEVATRGALLAVMKEHKVKVYRYDERIIEVLDAEKVKVKRATDDEEDD